MRKVVPQFVLTLILFLLCPLVQSAGPQSPAEKVRIYLLGEIHDNPQSLSQRLAFINVLIERGQQPVLLMEQFDRENQAALDLALATCADTDCVIKKVGGSGWNWDLYIPFIQLALDKKATMQVANLSNSDVRKVVFEGFSAVYDPQFIKRYQLDQLPPKLIKAQTIAIKDGHCGMLPEKAIAPMVQGQIARDVWMAYLIQNAKSNPVILIAGNGHVRKDAGVYQWLSTHEQSQTQVHGYIENKQSTDSQWYDYVHLMKPVLREDPCLVFKK
ncbi:ChaN family lipoprotein [Polynucleobacter antarcticus]|uniref:Haem-binding uptake Tiki superfamily ChaN domain-containing protein n=1 Tax=Polynucleobacter antarcticus TaxID=1743162 RepID=A0A6M9PHW8_9BURK|nr:ChaN family lipoprotein [Polynucleobacter antarcticus]QKM62450.1 hypothetical protein DCO16_04855 [Polynucleobacter antarcticus]